MLTIVASAAFLLSSRAEPWLLVAGAALLATGAYLDSADGVLARMTGTATPLGDYLDHAFDRFADVALLLGLSFSPWVPVEIGIVAVAGTLLTSYMGTQAQAVGVGRDYGGLMGRADRITLLFIVPVLQAILTYAGYTVPGGYNLLYLAVAWIAIAGMVTSVQRFWAALGELRKA